MPNDAGPSRLLVSAPAPAAASWALACLLACACKGPTSAGDQPLASASPQAKAEPAPLASVPATYESAQSVLLGSDAGPPPTPLRADRPAPPDTLAKDLPVYELSASLRTTDVPTPPKAPEVNGAGLDAARRRTEAVLTLDLAPAHARIVLERGAFVLPAGTELRARADHYGHIVLAAEGGMYWVAEPGALRALLGERRLDVAALSVALVTPSGDGGRRLGRATRRVEVVTRTAKASVELTRIGDAGEGGVLVCRVLLDLMNALPATPLCGEGDVPLRAELHWTAPSTLGTAPGEPAQAAGGIVFEAVSLARRLDVSAQELAAPPPSAVFSTALPLRTSDVLLTGDELAALRSGPVETAPSGPHAAPEGAPALVLANATDQMRFAWLDGVPLAWLAPGGRVAVLGLQRGRYVLQWRTFLADELEPPETLTVPGFNDAAGVDAGAPLP